MQAIPVIMQKTFLGMFSPVGKARPIPTRRVLEFIAHVDNTDKTLNHRAKHLLEMAVLTGPPVSKLMSDFLAAGTIWSSSMMVAAIGYQVETGATLIMHNDEETVVVELSASYIGMPDAKRTPAQPREWFDVKHPADILAAIECRLEIPMTMWTGLSNMGDNSEE